ncbi:hypothetical protein K0M31_005936 [Melipona bicolor]|uniref:ATPase AAA-type core domain-containing protein n=1 Tax=Melipona bicolor TaxID=60889 RepID=A0AA40FUD3_9HYME|nr:hypothetical protein K0M31_005936 [Melipona bicolor]
MFSAKSNVKSTLLYGPAELNKSFMFEAAIYWAEEGRCVVYITPAPLEELPAACHDRSNPAPTAFKLMRFMYLADYEALVDRLVELHTFASLPSVLLIDDFDAYTTNYKESEMSQDVHFARTCSLILDTMNSCARILKTNVYVCAWSSSAMKDICPYMIYFANIWNVTNEEESKTILLQKYTQTVPTEQCPIYRYCKLEDGTRVLKQILYEAAEDQS